MLTSEHAIVEFRAGRAVVDCLTRKTHGHYTGYAERMLAVYRQGIGRERRWLHQRVEEVFTDEPDCPARRVQAFCKLLDDAAVFAADAGGEAARLRVNVFSRAAAMHPLVEQPDRLFENDPARVKALIAAEYGVDWNDIDRRLYADVMSFQPLEAFADDLDAGAFLSHYNVAQLQACLYRAQSMSITATGDLKTILRYAKLARLMHEIVRLGPSRYRIELSGPASVLRETRRYGVNLARFLPALLACKGWRMTAVLRTPWDATAVLTVSDTDGYSSHLADPRPFDSSLEEAFAEKFGAMREGWRMIREGDILHEHQTTFVPDFTFRHEDGTEVFLEIVGFWTPEYLAKRREILGRFRRRRILLAVPQRSLREGVVPGENVVVFKTSLTIKPVLAALEAVRLGPRVPEP
ncbi:MAG TPA: DUF790 family protein [Phycisphaerales bacterium]|nr:DUF790 family protein [Phycisphaerales bacterium]